MGIFARNRTQLSEIEVNYDLNYTTESDTLSMITESFDNDFRVFESVFKRDILDSGDLLSESENSDVLLSLWENTLKIVKGTKAKLNTIIESFCNKIDEFKTGYCKQINESDYNNTFQQ